MTMRVLLRKKMFYYTRTQIQYFCTFIYEYRGIEENKSAEYESMTREAC